MKQINQKCHFNKSVNNAFTIVELLVVIVVIAILAAITIAAYTGISQKAVVSLLQSDLSNASTAIKAFQVENSNFPTTISTDCSTSPDTTTNKCIKLSGGNSVVGYSANNTSSPKSFLLIEKNSSYAYKVTDSTSPTQLATTTQPNTTPGAILELHAAKANAGTSPGINSPLTTTWADTSGNGNNGTLTGFSGETPWAGSGMGTDPYRLTFDRSADIGVLPDLGMSENKAYSIEVWYSAQSASSVNVYLYSEGDLGGSSRAGLRFWNNRLYANLVDSAGNSVQTPSTAPVTADGTVHHAIVTADSSWLTLYSDGGSPVQVSTSTIINPTDNSSRFGASWSGVGDATTKAIVALRLYPFTLTTAQVAANYAAGVTW